MVIVIMGVAGTGKSTLGRALSEALGWEFVDADDLHDARSIDLMRQGIPLTDEDRAPWLDRVHAVMASRGQAHGHLVIACSALRESYRQALARGIEQVVFVHLDAPAALLHERLRRRTGHFMPEALIESQLATLEPPAYAIRIDAGQPIDAQVAAVRRALTL